MKNLMILLVLLFGTNELLGQVYHKISPRLVDLMEKSENGQLDIIIELSAQVDVQAVHESFRSQSLDQQSRIQILLPALEEKARTTQAELVQWLQQKRGFPADEINSFWIFNGLAIPATSDDILALSERADVASLDWDAPVFVEEHGCEEIEESGSVPGSRELGLNIINAAPLWAMGYTGYGTIAFSSDTGIEGFHPAYSNRWMGSYGDLDAAWHVSGGSNGIPSNCGDHGTHTLGTMVGLDHATNDTIGVAFHANWIAARNICGGGTSTNIQAFQWALNPDGNIGTISDMPTVINSSWYDPSQEGFECTSTYVNTLEALEAAGIALIFSAGNAGSGVSTITPPKNINSTLVSAFCVANIVGNSADLLVNSSSSRGPSVCGGEGSILIKPEVSAPGTSVRSCVFDREYGTKTGTSMAAPHVAGAILLLKEAFPTLLSEDLKLALYYSAVDLGIEGEDNNYGNGLIDVKAAYDYLIDEGNVPITPNTELDLIGADVDPQEGYCDGALKMTFYVSNGGDEVITEFNYKVTMLRYNTATPMEVEGTWTGNLPKGEIVAANVDLGVLQSGNYFINFMPSLPNGQADPRPMNNAVAKLIDIDNAPAIEYNINAEIQESICEGSRVLLTGDLDTDVEYELLWFSDYLGNILLGQGNEWLSPIISEPTDIYVKAQLNIVSGADVPDQGEFTTDNKLRFNLLSDTEIATVDVVADSPGQLIVQVLNASDDIVKVKGFPLAEAGEHTLKLNFQLEAGAYKLAILAGKKLMEADEDISYPYVAGGEIIITGSENGNDTYAYFYNITINKDYSCEPHRIFLTPSEAPSFDLEINLASDTVNVFSDFDVSTIATDLASATWNFGDGTTITGLTPTHQYSDPGTYLISLVGVGPDGCSAAAQQEIVVLQTISSTRPGAGSGQITFYPNPTADHLTIELKNQKGAGDIHLYDLGGRLIRTLVTGDILQPVYQIDLSNIPAGMYFIKVKGDEFGDISQKLIVQ